MEQVLQFDSHGNFIRNLFKEGQGPGESQGVIDIWAAPNMIFLWANPKKILVYDYAGGLLKELSLREVGGAARFIYADERSILLHIPGRPDASAGSGIQDIPQNIIEITADNSPFKNIGSFPIRASVDVQDATSMDMLLLNTLHIVTKDGDSLFINHTPEYLVKNFNKSRGAVVRQFKRPYARVKWSDTFAGASGGPGGISRRPLRPEFLQDIYRLHLVGQTLWVQTSTFVEEKGILFDVYDEDGRYVDNFYVQSFSKGPFNESASTPLVIVGGFAYFAEQTNEGFIIIKKCRLIGL
jgi:hypothetical protein